MCYLFKANNVCGGEERITKYCCSPSSLHQCTDIVRMNCNEINVHNYTRVAFDFHLFYIFVVPIQIRLQYTHYSRGGPWLIHLAELESWISKNRLCLFPLLMSPLVKQAHKNSSFLSSLHHPIPYRSQSLSQTFVPQILFTRVLCAP